MSIELTDIDQCTAVLNIGGENFRCDGAADHKGWAHGSTAAQAIWCGSSVTSAASLPDGVIQ